MPKSFRDEVNRLLCGGFPKPPEEKLDFVNGPTEFSFAGAMEHFAHLAVNVNDKRHRDFMREQVSTQLLCGGDLSVAERAWLVYVLTKLNDMPHESKGRLIKGDERLEFMLDLVAFVNADELKYPSKKRGYVKARLYRAANELAKSYELVREMYYSKPFKTFRESTAKRWNNPPPYK